MTEGGRGRQKDPTGGGRGRQKEPAEGGRGRLAEGGRGRLAEGGRGRLAEGGRGRLAEGGRGRLADCSCPDQEGGSFPRNRSWRGSGEELSAPANHRSCLQLEERRGGGGGARSRHRSANTAPGHGPGLAPLHVP